MGNRTATFFDSYAHDFDSIYGTQNTLANRLVNRFLRRSMFLRYKMSIEGCNPIEGRTALDVGCGPGHFAVALAKKGASEVVGIDFADSMLDVARKHADQAGVEDRCDFILADFHEHDFQRDFDYSIVCGLMDYMPDAKKTIARVLEVTRKKAFFSFPAAGGILAWQRKLRYQSRCPLYLYTASQISDAIRSTTDNKFAVERIARDFFVAIDAA